MTTIIDQIEVTFQIQYSKTTKMSYDFSPEGLLSVKVPLKTNITDIEQFLIQNKKQVLTKIQRFENRSFISSRKTYDESELFLVLGSPTPLGQLIESESLDQENLETSIKSMYIKKTSKYIKKRLPQLEKHMGVKSKSYSIVDSPSTWGTCSSLKDLTFNYKLSMAPPVVMDYVIIHELCHIHHLNHDRSFWRLVGKYDPEYKAHSDYLAKFGFVMTI